MLDKEQILEDKRKRLGATIVVDDNEIVGIITDGDIRHMLEKQNDISSLAAKDIISKNPQVEAVFKSWKNNNSMKETTKHKGPSDSLARTVGATVAAVTAMSSSSLYKNS